MNKEEEKFKIKASQIKEFPNYFILSNGIILKIQVIKPIDDHRGYKKVILHNKGKKRRIRPHRLVAEYFVPNPNPETKVEVNHKDSNRNNNWDWNLEWLDKPDNLDHRNRYQKYLRSKR